MLIERSMSSPWLSNTYLVAVDEESDAVMIDAGGPVEPLLAILAERGQRLSHVLLTHHHGDHVVELGHVLEAHPDAEVLAHPLERERIMGTTGDLTPGDTLQIGGLAIEALHTPGHTDGMISLLVDGATVFTGDTLFKGSVGGVRGPGHTTYADIRHSVMDVLLALPAETQILPGHTDPTSVADELETNPFVRIWRGTDPEGTATTTVAGGPLEPTEATLILQASDYDGGTKAWVRWADGADDIVPGSWIQTPDAD